MPMPSPTPQPGISELSLSRSHPFETSAKDLLPACRFSRALLNHSRDRRSFTRAEEMGWMEQRSPRG